MLTSRTSGARISRTFDTLKEALSVGAAVITLVPVVVAGTAAVCGVVVGDERLAIFAGGVLLALFGLGAGALAGSSSIRRIVLGYRIERLEIIDEPDEQEPWTHHRRTRIDIRTTRAGLRNVWSTYRSESRGPDDGEEALAHYPKVTSPGHQCGNPHEEADSYWTVPICFDGPQPIGKEIHVAIEQTICEGRCLLRSWVSKTVSEPIDLLVIRVKIPSTAWPVDLEGRQIIPGQDRASTLRIDVDMADGEARLTVRRPVFGREYGIGWTRRGALGEFAGGGSMSSAHA